jgi:hypothetical protein
MTEHFINYNRFDITVKTISDVEYEVIAIAGKLIEFTARFTSTKQTKVDFNKRKECLIKAIENKKIIITPRKAVEGNALAITLEYHHAVYGVYVRNWIDLYYQPHSTIEEAISDAAIVMRYRCDK